MNQILVVGATGLLGSSAVRHLDKAGHQVRLLVRNAEKAVDLFGVRYEIVIGDVLNEENLAQALEGCQGVHISLDGNVELPAVKKISAFAKDAGVQRIGYVSGITVCEENTWFPYVAEKYAAEQVLESCGVPFTIFAPGWFYEMLGNFVKFGRALSFGRHPIHYHFMAVEDFGRMAAGAYGKEEAANQRFIIRGQEAIRFHDALRQYCAVLHPKIQRILTMPYGFAKLVARLRRSDEMAWAVAFMQYFEQVGECEGGEKADRILGNPQISFTDWLAA